MRGMARAAGAFGLRWQRRGTTKSIVSCLEIRPIGPEHTPLAVGRRRSRQRRLVASSFFRRLGFQASRPQCRSPLSRAPCRARFGGDRGGAVPPRQLDTITAGQGRWDEDPGTAPGSVVAGAVFAGGTRRVVSAYTGCLFEVTRWTDGAVLPVHALGERAVPMRQWSQVQALLCPGCADDALTTNPNWSPRASANA
jgi:hypothetical protein